MERLPLALSLRRCSLLELGQTAALLFDDLLTWRGEGGYGERLRSEQGLEREQARLFLQETEL